MTRRGNSSQRLPRHLGFIPDGNRRWARLRGLAAGDGYAYGVEPGLRLLDACRALHVEEVSIYGYTKENVRRPRAQVERFREACAEFARSAVSGGAALLVVGDSRSPAFPSALADLARERTPGDLRVNLLANYGWQWDLRTALRAPADGALRGAPLLSRLGSGSVPPVDLVVRWGGRSRLSGFLPLQCAYADFFGIETLWPDADRTDLDRALEWYQEQDVTMGG
jgi:undecaprenyl diphosphate synthase